MKKLILIAAGVLLVPIVIIATTILLPLHAESVLTKMGVPDSAQNISAIEVRDFDGAAPQRASRSLSLGGSMTFSDIVDFFRDRCDRNGFKINEDDLVSERFALTCTKKNGKNLAFRVARCLDTRCDVVTIAVVSW